VLRSTSFRSLRPLVLTIDAAVFYKVLYRDERPVPLPASLAGLRLFSDDTRAIRFAFGLPALQVLAVRTCDDYILRSLPLTLRKLHVHGQLPRGSPSSAAIDRLCEMPLVHLSLYPLPDYAWDVLAHRRPGLTALCTGVVPTLVHQDGDDRFPDACADRRGEGGVDTRLTFPAIQTFECAIHSGMHWARQLNLPSLCDLTVWIDSLCARSDSAAHIRALHDFLPEASLTSLAFCGTQTSHVGDVDPEPLRDLAVWRQTSSLRKLKLSDWTGDHLTLPWLATCTALTDLELDSTDAWTGSVDFLDITLPSITRLRCARYSIAPNDAFFRSFPSLTALDFWPYRTRFAADPIFGAGDVANGTAWQLACASTLTRITLTREPVAADDVAFLLDHGGGYTPIAAVFSPPSPPSTSLPSTPSVLPTTPAAFPTPSSSPQLSSLPSSPSHGHYCGLSVVRTVRMLRSSATAAMRLMLGDRGIECDVDHSDLFALP
jgi:hypothetical protein